ncbi:SDR family NAD(P)-dependent oxidoreductase [Microbacterium sp. 10M-3C3]|uniref:SDR family NAD(P)-dependent oxidoreductase n=1 Tax=Microbacterium sp. 10M-3C3 TaxID=2483401 RepID=UPI0013DDADCA|nr:SDR family NAD(P)-dependent oxidoreductase [Microbacterium sp. 10M-3C3]
MAGQRTAVITGGGRGIGAAAVDLLREDGWRVIALVRDRGAVPEAWADDSDVRVIQADVTDARSLEDAAREAGDVDLVVANAAAFAPWQETALAADLDAASAVLDVNVLGTWRTIQAFAPALEARHGSLIVVGSGGGSHGDPRFGIATQPGAASYAASKAAVHALARKAALELEGRVPVYVVDPGLTATAPGMAEMGARPPVDGARSILWPILGDTPVEPGSFTRDGQPLPW